MFERILVPLDGSALSEKALPYAAFLAERAGGRLFLIRAVEVWAATAPAAIEKEIHQRPAAEAELAAAAARLANQQLAVERAVYVGEAARAIDLAAQTNDASLIVMSTHGRSGFARWAYGSVAERVLQQRSRPVLLVPAQCDLRWTGARDKTIVVPLDGSPLAEQALAPARQLALALDASLTLMHVIEPPNWALASSGMGMGYLEAYDIERWVDEARPYAAGLARQLRQEGYTATAVTTSGYAAATIQALVQARDAAAIVMASHGRSGLPRLAMGSVAMGVVQRATAPVLVVRPGLGEKAAAGPAEAALQSA